MLSMTKLPATIKNIGILLSIGQSWTYMAPITIFATCNAIDKTREALIPPENKLFVSMIEYSQWTLQWEWFYHF